ncbi:MAG: hypothetical protein SGARI_000105 [Bacillariaceae sp.]
MSSRFNSRKGDDIQDFPLLVDDEDTPFHDSAQVCGMERGGDASESESCSLMDILSVSYSGPDDGNNNTNQLDAFHQQQGAFFNPVAQRHTRRRSNSEELEDLYSFSSNDDDGMLVEEEDRMTMDEYFFNANEHYSTYESSNSTPPPTGSIFIEEPLMPLIEDRAVTQSIYENNIPRAKTIRFADEVDSKLIDDQVLIRENSMTITDLQDKHLDIFDQGDTTKSSSIFTDDDSSHAESEFDDEEDDEDELEKKLLTSLMYNGATMGIVAGLGFVAKKVISTFQKSEDDPEGGNAVDQMMGDGANEVAREAATDAGTGGSLNNGNMNSSQGNAILFRSTYPTPSHMFSNLSCILFYVRPLHLPSLAWPQLPQLQHRRETTPLRLPSCLSFRLRAMITLSLAPGHYLYPFSPIQIQWIILRGTINLTLWLERSWRRTTQRPLNAMKSTREKWYQLRTNEVRLVPTLDTLTRIGAPKSYATPSVHIRIHSLVQR